MRLSYNHIYALWVTYKVSSGTLNPCSIKTLGDSVAQWLALWLAAREVVSSTLIAPAPQLPSEA